MKIKPIEEPLKEFGYIDADFVFMCPGCECHHGVWTTNRNSNNAIWSFNGSADKPTFSPSILVRYPVKEIMNICHSFVTDGKIQYLSDCTHKLAGQTIELPEI